MIVYDTQFNANEWFILVGFCLGYLTLALLPKRFTLTVTLLFVMCGIYSGFFFDHSLSVDPVDFYDVNDTSGYQFVDFISYLMFGPWSYLFFYVWDCLHLKFRYAPLFIFLWGMLSLGLEKIALLCHVYHYKNGFGLAYSFPIYLFTLSCWSFVYYLYRRRQPAL